MQEKQEEITQILSLKELDLKTTSNFCDLVLTFLLSIKDRLLCFCSRNQTTVQLVTVTCSVNFSNQLEPMFFVSVPLVGRKSDPCLGVFVDFGSLVPSLSTDSLAQL